MRTPQMISLLVSPAATFARRSADVGERATWLDVVAALSLPTVVVGACAAFTYGGALLAPHYLANVMLFAASFGIQSFAAALVARVLYGRRPRGVLVPFALTLVPHEVLFVALTGAAMLAPESRGVATRGAIALGLAFALACSVWNVLLTYTFFRSLAARELRRSSSRLRAGAAVLLHYGVIAVLVGLYMVAQDLLPYPPGRP